MTPLLLFFFFFCAKIDDSLEKENLTTTVLYHLELSAQRECQLEAQHPRRAHGASIVKQAQTSANVDVVKTSATSVGTSNKTHTDTHKTYRHIKFGGTTVSQTVTQATAILSSKLGSILSWNEIIHHHYKRTHCNMVEGSR